MKESYKIIKESNWPLGYDYDQDKNTYIYHTSCQNCHTALIFVIKKGIDLKTIFSKEPDCPSCGCTAIDGRHWNIPKD